MAALADIDDAVAAADQKSAGPALLGIEVRIDEELQAVLHAHQAHATVFDGGVALVAVGAALHRAHDPLRRWIAEDKARPVDGVSAAVEQALAHLAIDPEGGTDGPLLHQFAALFPAWGEASLVRNC